MRCGLAMRGWQRADGEATARGTTAAVRLCARIAEIGVHQRAGQPEGQVEAVHEEETTITSKKGNPVRSLHCSVRRTDPERQIKKKGDESNPAVEIKQSSGVRLRPSLRRLAADAVAEPRPEGAHHLLASPAELRPPTESLGDQRGRDRQAERQRRGQAGRRRRRWRQGRRRRGARRARQEGSREAQGPRQEGRPGKGQGCRRQEGRQEVEEGRGAQLVFTLKWRGLTRSLQSEEDEPSEPSEPSEEEDEDDEPPAKKKAAPKGKKSPAEVKKAQSEGGKKGAARSTRNSAK